MATLKERLFGFARRHKVITAAIVVIGGFWSATYCYSIARALVWRKAYAYQSLAARLEYERPHRDAAPPRLSQVSREVLEQADRYDANAGPRAESLKLLHSESVLRFVARDDDFGYKRMPSIGPSYIELRGPRENLAFDKVPEAPQTSVHPSTSGLTTNDAEVAAVAQSRNVSGTATPFSIVEAREFHAYSRNEFLDPSRFGYVESVDRVAGFASHGFTWRPDRSFARSDTWKTVRLELLSWLKHDSPRVYVSEKFPRMDELASAETRDLNAFESSALERLVAGEELETAATANRIQMLGALRAGKSCQKCHGVPYGTLLGAFSYELRRDPPVAEPPPTVTAAVQ